MNQENRNKVDNYLNNGFIYSTSPLYFRGYESPVEEFDPNKYSVEEMCKRVLMLTMKYSSYNKDTGDYECSYGRNRSSLDIWRHTKYYYPDVTIYEVMSALYNIYTENDGFIGFYCTDINRRVFKVGTRISRQHYMENMYVYCGKELDEYGLKWDDWKDI